MIDENVHGHVGGRRRRGGTREQKQKQKQKQKTDLDLDKVGGSDQAYARAALDPHLAIGIVVPCAPRSASTPA